MPTPLLIQGTALLAALTCWLTVLPQYARAQTPPAPVPPPACEFVLGEAYRQLLGERLLAESAVSGVWGEQLAAITTALHVFSNKFELERNQSEFVKTDLARVLERLRQTQLELGKARAELDKLKAAPASPEVPPRQ